MQVIYKEYFHTQDHSWSFSLIFSSIFIFFSGGLGKPFFKVNRSLILNLILVFFICTSFGHYSMQCKLYNTNIHIRHMAEMIIQLLQGRNEDLCMWQWKNRCWSTSLDKLKWGSCSNTSSLK